MRKVREHGPSRAPCCIGVRMFTFRAPGGWQGEARHDDHVGRVTGLVWQSGYHLTRWGACRALQVTRRAAPTGNPTEDDQ